MPVMRPGTKQIVSSSSKKLRKAKDAGLTQSKEFRVPLQLLESLESLESSESLEHLRSLALTPYLLNILLKLVITDGTGSPSQCACRESVEPLVH